MVPYVSSIDSAIGRCSELRAAHQTCLSWRLDLNLFSMRDQKALAVPKWGFFLGDALLVGAAVLIYSKAEAPLGIWQGGLILLGVGTGAFLTILPYVLEYRVLARLAENQALTDAVEQIQNLQKVGEQIAAATARWQSVQEVADRVAGTSQAIAERMTAEAKAFTEFMQRANDSEKATLRLEADKLRRAESDWVHVLMRMLDHVYALHVGAVRSGQPNLISQLDHFQHACRDAARRIGLAPFAADATEPFDAQRHQLMEGEEAHEGATVAETIATGYTFQGRLLRPALVRLQGGNGNGGETGNGKDQADNQRELPMASPKPAQL
jgi:molecular chaperone GrpE (heat shock protein)